jgi:hypothetical protein
MKTICNNALIMRKLIGNEDANESTGLMSQTCEEMGCTRERVNTCLQDVIVSKYELEQRGQYIMENNYGIDYNTLSGVSVLIDKFVKELNLSILINKKPEAKEKLKAYAKGAFNEKINQLK